MDSFNFLDAHYFAKAREVYDTDEYTNLVMMYNGESFDNTKILEYSDKDIISSLNSIMLYGISLLGSSAKESRGYYMHSDSAGRCKTSISDCLRNFLLDSGISCLITNIRTMYNNSISNNPEKIKVFNSYKFCAVYIIDDIGIDDLSNNTSESKNINNMLYDVLNYRLQRGMVTCFTSNYSIDKLIERGYYMQSVDRIRELSKGMVIKIAGNTIRGNTPALVDAKKLKERRDFISKKLSEAPKKTIESPKAMDDEELLEALKKSIEENPNSPISKMKMNLIKAIEQRLEKKKNMATSR